MTINVNPRMLEYMHLHSGGLQFVVEAASDPDAAVRGLDEARRRIAVIGHPEEEGEPCYKYMSEIDVGAAGPSLTVDIRDAEAYPWLLHEVLEAVVSALEDSGLEDALLTFPDNPRQRLGDAVLTGLVPAKLHSALVSRIERGDDPRSIASWLAAESQRLDQGAYDEEPPRDEARDDQWVQAYGLILALFGLISSSKHKGLSDSDVLARVIAFLQAQKRVMDAAP